MALVTSGGDTTVIVLDNDEAEALAALLDIDMNEPAGLEPGMMDMLADLAGALFTHKEGMDR